MGIKNLSAGRYIRVQNKTSADLAYSGTIGVYYLPFDIDFSKGNHKLVFQSSVNATNNCTTRMYLYATSGDLFDQTPTQVAVNGVAVENTSNGSGTTVVSSLPSNTMDITYNSASYYPASDSPIGGIIDFICDGSLLTINSTVHYKCLSNFYHQCRASVTGELDANTKTIWIGLGNANLPQRGTLSLYRY